MIVGVDIGNAMVGCAMVGADGRQYLVPDRFQDDQLRTPAIVAGTAGIAFVGKQAATLGRAVRGMPLFSQIPDELDAAKRGVVDESAQTFLPLEALLAVILNKLRDDVASYTGEVPQGCVSVLPMHADQWVRERLLAAGELAEMQILGFVEQPLAAAAALWGETASGPFLVVDVGLNDTRICVVENSESGWQSLGSIRATDVSGRFIDDAIVDLVYGELERLEIKLQLDRPGTWDTLRLASEQLKIAYSAERVRVSKTIFAGGRAVEINLRRSNLSEVFATFAGRVAAHCRECLTTVAVDPKEITGYGFTGSTFALRELVDLLAKELSIPEERLHCRAPEGIAAFGASLKTQGRDTARDTPQSHMDGNSVLSGRAGYHIGVRVKTREGIKIDRFLQRGATLPAKAGRSYSVPAAGTSLTVGLFQLDSADARFSEHGEWLGDLMLPIGDAPRPSRLEVQTQFMTDGTIVLSGSFPDTDESRSIVLGLERDVRLEHLAGIRSLLTGLPINPE